ncbi:leucine-rich repeat-containing protein 70 [Egretta garzetta]|uniref:leucine-rich repeat-containing protein 70 n=1 Tax=Egretta garzetta TaxID=188379 RepID=UPI00051EEDF9|nr:leucine-rich repeat-containing protein 70 [Egretta garzetta]XP_035757093.1 leucine-rich repeat-containing protein 70 [Egretta garzetta]
MSEKAKDRDMCGLQSSPPCPGAFLYILNCFLWLLLQKEAHGCPAACQLCTGRQVSCRNLGLSSIPRNFPKTTILVYLSGNNISRVTPHELRGLQKLAALYMDNSSISYVHPKAFVELRKLCYLHLNNNNIKRLDPGIFEGLSNLHCLYLQNNQIAFVPRGLFSDLLSVRYLTLQRNRLSVLGSGTFLGMLSLQTLNLANNKISRISDSAFHHLENLSYLFLEGNNLTLVPSNAIGRLKNLERLSLSHNPIGSIHPFAFKGLNKLRYLSLKNVKLKCIAVNGFFGLNNLSQLILSYNELENINSSTFTLLSNVMYLQLDRNKITSIGDGTFEKMGQSLKILSLAFNNITELQPEVLKPLVSLTHLQVNYNPWNCSCKMLGLLNWLASSPISVKIHCQNPLSMRGRPLHYIRWTQFANCSSPTASPDAALSLGSVGVHHSTTTLLVAWHKGNRHNVFEQFVNAGTRYVAFWEGTTATSANPLPYEENAAEIPPQATTVLSTLPVQIPAQIIPTNRTIEEKGLFPTDAIPVSLKTSLLCTQQVEKLNQAFDILLAFFILACAVILFLTCKIIHFRQKLKVLENSGEKRIEYYGFYQPGRYNITDPVQSLTQNSMGHSELDQIRLLKRTASESQAQVILFEHSSL